MAPFTLAHLSDPHLPPLPKPRLMRSRGQARARLSQLDPQPPQISPPRGARRAGRRHAGADGPTTSRSPAISSIWRWRRSSRRRAPGSTASARPTASPTIPGNHDAYVRATTHRFAETLRRLSARRRRQRTAFPFVRRRGPLALIGVSSAVPTAAADGDGHARPRCSSMRSKRILGATRRPRTPSACCWCIIPCSPDSRQKRMTDSRPRCWRC